jgi:hypothetical protein
MPPNSRQSAPSISFVYPLLFALVIFSALAVLLFLPSLPIHNSKEYLTILNSILAATGCFLLSRRWLASFDASAIAGAVFGFGPFLLSFKIYHPLAGSVVALLPWLFCPVALWDRYSPPSAPLQTRRLILLLVPFGCILLFFWLSSQPWLGPYDLMPRTQQFHLTDLPTLAGFPGPWGKQITLGLYANVFILGVMGLFVYLALLRVSVLIPVLAGLVLTFFQPIFNVPPVLWMAIPMLFVSILAGLGAQALAWAGTADRKWILLCMLIAALLGGLCLAKAWFGQDRGFLFSAGMYGISFLMTAILFFLVRAQLRWHLFRWILIAAAAGLDLFITGRLMLAGLS